ncbi:MAG: hypothetical protein ACLFM0_06185 [Spirochaetales bacterium]
MVFREQTEDHKVYLNSSEESLDDSQLRLRSESSEGDVHEVIVDDSLQTERWSFTRNNDDSTDLVAEREGRRIDIRGTLKGRTIRRTERLDDDDPWVQSIEKSLEPFVLSDDETTEFWTLQPDDLTLRKLRARKRGREKVEVDGEKIEVWNVRISLPGVGSVFWGANYWYRTSDGQFVKYEGVRGGPGTPTTTVEKVDG